MGKAAVWIVGIVIVAGTGYLVYRHFAVAKVDKAAQVSYLIANNYSGGDPAQLMGFGNDFIAAWYKAATTLSTTFVYSGKTYNTTGGKAV